MTPHKPAQTDFDCVAGTCGEVVGGPPGSFLPMDLECGALYLGGGLSALQQDLCYSRPGSEHCRRGELHSAGSPETDARPYHVRPRREATYLHERRLPFQAPLPMQATAPLLPVVQASSTIAQDGRGERYAAR